MSSATADVKPDVREFGVSGLGDWNPRPVVALLGVVRVPGGGSHIPGGLKTEKFGDVFGVGSTLVDVRGPVPPETVDLASGRDLNSICGGCRIISTNVPHCPITFPVDIILPNIYPSTTVNEITEHINEWFVETASVPITCSVSHTKGGNDIWVFFSLRVMSACCSGQDDIEYKSGVQNGSVVLSGASVREKPLGEKSFHVNVVCFAARDCNMDEMSALHTFCSKKNRH